MNPTPNIPNDSSPEFLVQISTIWSNIQRIQAGPNQANGRALEQFFHRYHRAILNYLLRCVHHEETASDLFQEFALRFLRGDFAQARSQNGSFRKYLKSALINLVHDHFSKKTRSMPPLPEQDWEQPADEFDYVLRDDLLSQTWSQLQQAESEGGAPFFTALRARADHPEWTALELADYLARVQNLPSTPSESATRKLVQRARDTFAERLLGVTHDLLDEASWDQVADELAELGLKQYCERVLDDHIRPKK